MKRKRPDLNKWYRPDIRFEARAGLALWSRKVMDQALEKTLFNKLLKGEHDNG